MTSVVRFRLTLLSFSFPGAKTAVSVFSRQSDATQQEKDLIKAVQEPEMIMQILGNIKISTPGLNAIQQKNKKK